MAFNTITAYSTNNNVAHFFNISDEDGVQVQGPLVATFGGGQSRKYTVDIPAALPTGYYTYSMQQTSNNRLRSQGEFWWDNLTQCILSSAEYNYLVNTKARFDQIDTDHATGTTERAAILAAINAIAVPTAAAIATAVEAALLDDGDGQAFKDGLAATIEAALANEADGNATIAVFQGAVTAALNAYDGPTNSELQAGVTAIQADIGNLNDISSADVQSELVSYDAATSMELASALNDILNSGGLSVAQNETLIRIRDIVEADEIYSATGGTGTVQKLLKGTSTVLQTKDVITTTPCDISTSIIEQ